VLGGLGVGPPCGSGPLVPAWLWLSDVPARGLLDLVTGSAACAGVAGADPSALVVGDGMLKVAFSCVP
jgi:hypothetical protein